jgi:hypothetical protein
VWSSELLHLQKVGRNPPDQTTVVLDNGILTGTALEDTMDSATRACIEIHPIASIELERIQRPKLILANVDDIAQLIQILPRSEEDPLLDVL